MPRAKGIRPTFTCEGCGKQVEIPPRGRARSFCCRSCWREHNRTPIADRFAAYVGPTNENGCILWIGLANEHGYGMIGRGGKHGGHCLATRVAWELAHGPIPDGLYVLHRCDNPKCVNVAHLFLGTHADNMADKVAKRRHSFGAHRPCAKLTDDNIRAIRLRYSGGGITQQALADEYGVAISQINWAVNRLSWKHVE